MGRAGSQKLPFVNIVENLRSQIYIAISLIIYMCKSGSWSKLTEQHLLCTLVEQCNVELIKYLDVGPQAQLPPPYLEDISAFLTLVLS